MNKPGSTMKSIQKRFYNVLQQQQQPPLPSPRLRSNSASSSRSLYTAGSGSNVLPLSFFDSPPPPQNSRPLLSTNRLPVDAKGEVEGPNHPQTQHTQPPFSALTAPPSNSSLAAQATGQYALFPYSSLHAVPLYSAFSSSTAESHATPKRQRLRYQLDVGAYGIPKKSRTNAVGGRDGARLMHTRASDDMNLAVQIGEDAYFIRDNAMGVADGVGGWSRVKNSDLSSRSSSSPTPSALFARRLMHFCSAEVDSHTPSPSLPIPIPPSGRPPAPLSFNSFSTPRRPSPILASNASPWYWSDPPTTPISNSALEEDLDDSLEELEEGLDVLMILERAYERTLKAHVVPVAPSPSPPLPIPSVSFSSSPSSKYPSPPPSPRPSPVPDTNATTIPLLSGSSTALLAVLDHVPRSTTSCRSDPSSRAGADIYDAVIKIAHIGDCMAMLVRGEDIAWRSEEMWWNFNTPVQLGPSTPSSPSTSAHIFTLPVQADDILILASDGLSDNLWDEDVLDEVVRFKRSFLGGDNNPAQGQKSRSESVPMSSDESGAAERLLRRRTLAGMLSEALCSRARRVSERKGTRLTEEAEEDEVPFARRARELGKVFRGGKNDDISVIVAVISPAADLAQQPKQGFRAELV